MALRGRLRGLRDGVRRGVAATLNPRVLALSADAYWVAHGTRAFYFRRRPGEDFIQGAMLAGRRFYEAAFLSELLRRLEGRAGAAVDAGANIGNHAVFLAAIGGRPVAAFEPVAANHALLCENIALNRLGDRVTAHRAALGETSGTIRLAAQRAGNHGSFAASEAAGAEEAPLLPLDATLSGAPEGVRLPRPVALLKIDTEGHEVPVLRGARGLLAADRPVVAAECESLATLEAMLEVLGPLGYAPVSVHNATPTVILAPDGRAADAEVRARIAAHEAQEGR